ncbi:unnamed protein product [Brugia timori]|uniref:Transposase n=1 Tax=Brugia timori TaxID=42155 RepID=A0A0R3Q7K8_9BILA|nr:unnamed protein product [Brugia timori]
MNKCSKTKENGPQLSHYDSDKQIATLMHLLTQTNKGRRQSC